jgi:hypothetical protein
MSERLWRLTPPRPPSEIRAEDVWAVLGVTPEVLSEPSAMWLLLRAALVVYGEGEGGPIHEALADARLCALFGVTSFEAGSFVPALREMLEEKPPAWGEGLEDFQIKVTSTLAHGVVHSGWMRDHAPSVNLVGDTVTFNGNQHHHELPPVQHPRIVVDYGPGLGIRFIQREHFVACTNGRPFHYIPITKSSFPQQFGVFYLMQLYGDEAVSEYLSRGFAVQRTDGILSASTAMLSHPARGHVDLIFCSGLQMAARPELEAGILNAFPLLGSGGTFLLRSQKQREPPESATIDDMLEIAYRAGFSEPRLFDSISANQKPVLTAIFTKR